MSRLVEFRTYRLKAGRGPEFLQIMHEASLPLLRAWGMDVVHAGPCALEADGFLLVRAYDNAEDLRRTQEAFYRSEAWRQGPREAVLACIEAHLSVTLEMEEAALQALRNL